MTEKKYSYLEVKRDADPDEFVFSKPIETPDIIAPPNPNLPNLNISTTHQVATAEIFPEDYLIINDVYLTGVPLTAIKFESPTDVFVGETIRTQAPVIASEGRQDLIMSLSLVFKPGEQQQIKLRRLLAVLTRNPIAFVYSNRIAREVGLQAFESTIFILESGTLRSSAETVGAVILDLTFHFFNYKPFSHHHYYNAYIGRVKSQSTEIGEKNTASIDLGQIKGYEPQEYRLSQQAEQFQANLQDQISAAKNLKGVNLPTPFPSASEAWMLYANKLVNDHAVPITEYPSDFIGFKVNKYTYISPPANARFGGGRIKNGMKDLVPYPSAYQLGPITGTPRGVESTQDYATQEAMDSYTKATKFVNTKTGQSISIKLLDSDNRPDPQAAQALSKLWKVGKYANVADIQIDLVARLANLTNKFPGRTIRIISLSRAPGQKALQKIQQGLDVNRHVTGQAIDLQIDGVPNDKICRYMRTVPKTGVGFYPNCIFCHIDARDKPMFWVDESRNGETARNVPPSEREAWWKSYWRDRGQEEIEADQEEFGNKDELNKAISKQRQQAVKDAVLAVEKKRKELVNAGAESKDRLNRENQRLSEEARQAWIDAMADQGYYYYTDDPKVLNTFYSTSQVLIAGDPTLQKNGKVSPNIVCSSIAVSFGHRIAPMRLKSQSFNTYQFMGAGNKSGQIVLTYSGSRGHISAEALKANILYVARENARTFGAVIPEAGSIELISTLSEFGHQNIILDLLNIKNIVISNIEEISTSDAVDRHEIVLDFIVQDFAEEAYKKDNGTTFDLKKRIIRALMSLVSNRKIDDKYKIMPRTYLARPDLQNPGEFIIQPNVPSWIVRLAKATADISNSIEEDLPPLDWSISKSDGKTWADIYEEYGARRVFKGNGDNRSQTIGPITTIAPGVSAVNLSMSGMSNTIPETDGGEATSQTHKRLFRSWLDQMDAVIKETYQYVSDEENFKYYFGNLGDDIVNSVTVDMTSCYKDLELPVFPGTAIELPPEFYIYNDSDENPFVATATDRKNLELIMKRQAEVELTTMKHTMEDGLLGGTYVSENLGRIMEQRRESLKINQAEFDYHRNFMARLLESCKTWEPIYYIHDPSIDNDAEVKVWQGDVAAKFGGGGFDDQKLQFLDSLIQISPYLREGRHWETPYDSSAAAKQEIVKSLFTSQYNQLGLGPNPNYIAADKGIMGDPTANLASQEKAQETQAAKLAQVTGKPVDLPGRTVTADNAVVVGHEKDIDWAGLAKTAYDYALPLHVFKYVQKAIATAVTLPWRIILDKESGDTLYEILSDPIRVGWKAITGSHADEQLRQAAQEVAEHPMATKLETLSQYDYLGKLAAGVAIGSIQNDISMRRAYPTLKIYFIEDDAEDTEMINAAVRRAFDDFYSYSAIQEVRIVQSRKQAAALATIRMTNVGGKLFRRRFGDTDPGKYDVEKQGIFAETEKEEPFERMILQEGVKVQIRIGYSSDPEKLTTRFLGRVVEVAPTEDTKLIEIMLQGFGAELESVELGPIVDGPVYLSTQQALSAAIMQPSIVTFGRQSKSNRFNPAEIRHAFTGGRAEGGLSSPADIIRRWADDNYNDLLRQYTFLNKPQDDNIFAPDPKIYATGWEKFWNNAWYYRPLNQTPWEIFKEHELRHPNYISAAVPYGHSSRMTMFFGPKNAHYWSKPPSALEIFLSESIYNGLLEMKKLSASGTDTAIICQKYRELSAVSPTLAEALINDMILAGDSNRTNMELSYQFGRFIPFRGYHYVDSYHHILKNEIRTSVDGTFNEVEVLYMESEDAFATGGTWSPIGNLIGTADKAWTSAEEKREKALKNLSNGQEGVFTLRLDERIPEGYIRSYREAFPGCCTDLMAKRYAQGILGRYLKDAYKGELVIIGNETIRPYDTIFLSDHSIDMHGPVDVETVVDVISSDTGYIQIITPDMCVDLNEIYSVAAFDLAASAISYIWPSALSAADGNLAMAPIQGVGFLAVMAGVKFVQWTQEGDPVIVTPLSFGGKPFVGITLGPQRGTLFSTVFGDWRQYMHDLSDGWNKMSLSEEALDISLGFKTWFYSLLGTGLEG